MSFNNTETVLAQNENEKHQKTSAVFTIKPRNRSNECHIKFKGILKSSEKLGDEIVELDKPIHPDFATVGKHAIPIKNIGSFEIIGRIYRCNIVGAHIIASDRYPLMFLNIHYEKPMVSGSLLQLFFSIDIDRNIKRSITDNKQYVNLRFTGNWVQHIDCDDEMVENYEKILIEMLEKDGADKFYTSENTDIIELRNNLTDDDVVNWIDKYVDTERVYYDNLMNNQSMEFDSTRKTRDYLLEICQSEKFHKFLKIAMKCREIHRRREAGLSDDDNLYVVPKNVIKLDDIKNDLLKNDELILDEDE